jgi:plastocyanin
MRRLSALLFLVIALACNKATNTEPVAPLQATVLATASNTFVDDNTAIRVGGTVTWQFQATHSVIFTSKPGVPTDIPENASGATVNRTFSTSGVFEYHCGVAGHDHNGIITVRTP